MARRSRASRIEKPGGTKTAVCLHGCFVPSCFSMWQPPAAASGQSADSLSSCASWASWFVSPVVESDRVTGTPTAEFPIPPPIEPMLAKLAEDLPAGGGFLYEPKWDGFRAIVFRSASELFIQSRDLRPLDRYFPELHDVLLER